MIVPIKFHAFYLKQERDNFPTFSSSFERWLPDLEIILVEESNSLYFQFKFRSSQVCSFQVCSFRDCKDSISIVIELILCISSHISKWLHTNFRHQLRILLFFNFFFTFSDHFPVLSDSDCDRVDHKKGQEFEFATSLLTIIVHQRSLERQPVC